MFDLQKKMLKSSSLMTLGFFAGGNIYCSVLGGLGGLLQARWLAPEVFGEFQKYGILVSYLTIGTVLVQDGLIRQYPYWLGKGDAEKAHRVSATAKWFYLLLSYAVSVVYLGLAAESVWRGNVRALCAWLTQLVNAWNRIYGTYQSVMYRTSQDFRRYSCILMTNRTFDFMMLALIKIWGFWGLLVRFTASSLLGLWLNEHYAPVRIKALLDRRVLAGLVKISVPLSLPGYINTSGIAASMSVVILSKCGQEGLGLYGLALAFQQMAVTFNSSLSQIFTVKIAGKYGETEQIGACWRYIRLPVLCSTVIAMGMAVGLCLVVGPFIRVLLPKYEAAVPVIYVMSLFLPLEALYLPMHIFRAALCHKTNLALSAIRVIAGACLYLVLPKTLVALSFVPLFGMACAIAVGYILLFFGKYERL